MSQPDTTARCPMVGTLWPAQRDPDRPFSCPGCGADVILKVDEWGGETYFPSHTPGPALHGPATIRPR